MDDNQQTTASKTKHERKNGILLSVIIPCYNESKNLLDLTEMISPYLDEAIGEKNWQFIFIDNGSVDDTKEIVSSIQKRWPPSLLISLKQANYGNALKHGLQNAQGPWALIINVDFWDGLFIKWAWKNRNKYDLIIGSKRGDPDLDKRAKYRKVLSWGLNVLLQLVFGLVPTDTHGQKLLCMSSIKPILNKCVMTRGQYDTEFTLRSQRAGLKIAEVPVPIKEIRKQRNLMITKILQNFMDITILKFILMKVPATSGIHYHRFSRDDM